jgi:signal peptidase II
MTSAPPVSSDPAVDPTPRRPHPGGLIPITTIGVGLIWLLLDQATKVLAVHTLEAQGRIVDLGFIDLNVIRNSGGAFGIPGIPGMFVVVTIIVIGLVVRALPSTDRLSLAVAYGLVCGGALGNVMDRLFRDPGFPSGAVVDFFDLRWWPIFNIADIGIVLGALSIAVLMTMLDREERSAAALAANDSVRPDTSTPGR